MVVRFSRFASRAGFVSLRQKIVRRCHALRGDGSQRSLTSHLNRGVDGVFEIVRVVGRGLVSIAEVHDLASCSVLFSSGSKHTAACRSSARLDIAEVAHAKA